ncbi:MAG: ATP-binding protein [Aureispira sp.]
MHYITIIFFLLILPQNTLAQPPTAYIQELGFEDGLPSLSITHLLQNQQGFIWMGTSDNGVLRYDGVRFKTYTKTSHQLSFNAVLDLEEDPTGHLWVLTGSRGEGMRAIDILHPSTGQVESLSNYLEQPTLPFDINTIYKIQQNIDGSIWLMGAQNLVYEYKAHQLTLLGSCPNKGVIFKRSDPLASYHYLAWDSIAQKNNSSSLAHLHWSTQALELIPDTFQAEIYFAPFSISASNTIYVEKLGKETSIFYRQKGQEPLEELFELPKAASKWYYQAPYFYVIKTGYLEIREEQTGAIVQNIPLAINPGISKAYFDQQGGIWLNNNEALIHVVPFVSPFDWKQLFSKKDKSPSPTRGIITQNNKVYHAFANVFATPDSNISFYPSSPFIYGMAKNHQGNLLLALDHKGILNYNPTTDSFHLSPLAIDNARLILWQPYEDSKGQVWVGSSKGLYYLDKNDQLLKEWQGYGVNTQLKNSAIYHFYENEQGCWLCTSSGLYLLDQDKTKIVQHLHSNAPATEYIPYDHLSHLHEDKEGNFWLSSKGGGLIFWNPSTLQSTSYTRTQGLSHNVIYAVYSDAFNNLWLPSNRGLMRFNKETGLVNTYMPEDGLPHYEFNTIAHHQDTTGRLYFGTLQGSISFHPADLQKRVQEHPIQLTAVHRQDWQEEGIKDLTSTVNHNKTLLLPPSTKEFEIQFALLDYRNTQNNRYAYKIEGYDQDWHYTTTPVLSMNTLPYGQYTLRLRAQASGSSWQEADFTLHIVVAFPFYLQWWFLVLVLLGISLLVYVLFKWRLSKLNVRQIELEQMVAQRTATIAQDKALIEEQAEELKALDKIKSRFFANISHELRTPLTLILGPLAYILDNPEAWEEQHVRQQLTTMKRNGKNLLQLVEEILDLSKLEANKLELKEEATPVEQFFEHLFAVFEPQFQAQQLDYELMFLLEQEHLYCLIDQQKTRKIVHNFLSNAIKFTPRNGKITLSVIEQAEHLCIRVTDTGKGVHSKDLPHIFERFYQSRQADQAAYGGTGIGLALVSEFAQLMQAKVYAESTLGIGSQFYFEFPKKQAAPQNITQQLQTTLDILEEEPIEDIGTDFTILLVEDNVDMRAFVQELLCQRYTVLTANNGLEGLEQLQKHQDQISLVVSDVMMPELDGIGLLKAIKSRPQGNTLPVIMLTALAAERDKLHALTTGVDDYLTKPFSPNELLVRVQNLLYNYHQRLLVQKEEAVLAIPQEEDKKAVEDNTPTPPENPLAQHHIQNNEWIKNIEQLILSSIPKRILSVEDLAFEVHLSSRQLNRKMKQMTGLTPAKFIKEVQLQIARKELENGRFLSVSEVAYKCGFDLPNTFSKVFKKRFGKSPKEYLD